MTIYNISEKAAVSRWGAVAGTAVGVGFVFSGGHLAALSAAGSVFVAIREGKVGDVASHSGKEVGNIQRKAVVLNEKHKVTAKVQAAAGCAFALIREGKVRDMARQSGSGVVKIQRKEVALNEKHKVTEKVQAAAAEVVCKTKELAERHKITEQAHTAAAGVVNKAKNINHQFRLAGSSC
jgi:hypothetical protein